MAGDTGGDGVLSNWEHRRTRFSAVHDWRINVEQMLEIVTNRLINTDIGTKRQKLHVTHKNTKSYTQVETHTNTNKLLSKRLGARIY